MSRIWGPSASGKLFTRSTDWKLALTDERFSVRSGAIYAEGSVACLETLRVEPGHFWSAIALPIPDGRSLSLDGIPNAAAAEMATAIAKTVRRVRIAQLIANFGHAIKPTLQWVQKVRAACKAQLASRGWLTEEFKTAFEGLKPKGLADLLVEPEVVHHLDAQSAEIKEAVNFWNTSFRTVTDEINEHHLAQGLQDSKTFFDTVEKSPLSEEQARAVLCFDNRVLLVASAGSGKTSTMVAKAGYALSKGYFAADKILLLAFNSDAAAELRERIDARLRPLGLPIRTRSDNQNSLGVGSHQQFANQQTCHHRFTSTRIIRQHVAEGLPGQHRFINRRDLVWKRFDVGGMNSHHWVEQVREIDPTGLDSKLEISARGIERPGATCLGNREIRFLTPEDHPVVHLPRRGSIDDSHCIDANRLCSNDLYHNARFNAGNHGIPADHLSNKDRSLKIENCHPSREEIVRLILTVSSDVHEKLTLIHFASN